ncbi:MAG: hypothetical protein JOZ57_17845 [Abitibacteriaceae bacterium]|nr:hypothetical protein [Abditibacteriaceae bacterium]
MELPFVLNDWVRFDRPGTYSVYVTTRRVLRDTGKIPTDGLSVLFSGAEPLETTSSALTIEVVPLDPAWAQAQVVAQQARWADKSRPTAGQPRVQGDVAHLGTPEAARAIIERMGANTEPRSSGDDSWAWRPMLVGYPDRAWLIGEMGRRIDRGDYAVTQGYLSSLALLMAMATEPHPTGADPTPPQYTKEAAGKWVAHPTPAQALHTAWEIRLQAVEDKSLRQLWHRVADAVPAKAAPAKAMTLHTLLELAWLDGRVGPDATAQARVPKLVKELAPVFDLLPPLPQQYLLGDEWVRIKSPLFLPALRRLSDNTPADDYNRYRELPGLIARRLQELVSGATNPTVAVAPANLTLAQEQDAISQLNSTVATTVAQAARLLSSRGSAQAEAALMNRLKSTSDEPDPQLRERVEPVLVEALAGAQAWLCDAAALRAIRDLCRTDGGRKAIDNYLQSVSAPQIHVDYQIGEHERWGVGHYRGEGLANLRQKLLQFPRGTVFSWQTLSYGEAEINVFQELQQLARAHGMTLERWIMPASMQRGFGG